MAIADRVYTSGLQEMLDSGVTPLGNGAALLVDATFEFDATATTAPSSEISDVGYSRATVTYSVTADATANFPRVSIDLADFSFSGFDGATEVHAIVFLTSSGKPLAVINGTAGIQALPLTPAAADPISVETGSLGLIRIATQG